jgi:integrase
MEINKIGISRGKGCNQNWRINGIDVKLACKTDIEVQNLIDKVKVTLNSKCDLYSITDCYNRRDILKVISLFFNDIGQDYLYHKIYKLTKEKGEFTKAEFFVNLLKLKDRNELWNLHKDIDIKDFLDTFIELTKKAHIDVFDIKGHLERKQSFADIATKLAPGRIIRYCYHDFHDLFLAYVEHFCKQYTLNFKVVQLHPVLSDIFGRNNSVSRGAETGETRDVELIYEELHLIVNKEYEYQCSYFPKTNNLRMTMDSDSWTMFFLRGVALKGREFNFSIIKSPTLKYEVKLWYKESILKHRNDFEGLNSNVNLLNESTNFLSTNSSDIRHFADISTADVVSLYSYLEDDFISYKNENLALQTIAVAFSDLRQLVNFLMEYATEKAEMNQRVFYPIPQRNPFYDIEFNNLAKMGKKTEIIPDEVMTQILAHSDELKPEHQIILKIFDETGMRAKEVLLLEKDCLDDETNELYYVQYKTLSARRKSGYQDRKLIYVTDEVKLLIREQIEKTSELRDKFNIPYIFVNGSNAISKAMPSNSGFVYAINKLIEKYNIRDYENELWKFTSRQVRKTLARTMVLNNATPMELMAVLGHTNPHTALKHYEEVERKKLEEMDTVFFKQQFEVSIGKENLENFTEEERRALYVDFRLNYREVEVGKCTKHFSEEPCGKISGKMSCVNCSKCATGKKYLPKWIELRDSQKLMVEQLIDNYKQEGISEYENFVEYQREIYFLQCYEDVVQRLTNE